MPSLFGAPAFSLIPCYHDVSQQIPRASDRHLVFWNGESAMGAFTANQPVLDPLRELIEFFRQRYPNGGTISSRAIPPNSLIT